MYRCRGKKKISLCNHNIFCKEEKKRQKMGTLETKLDFEKWY